jgi:hypothetical protein
MLKLGHVNGSSPRGLLPCTRLTIPVLCAMTISACSGAAHGGQGNAGTPPSLFDAGGQGGSGSGEASSTPNKPSSPATRMPEPPPGSCSMDAGQCGDASQAGSSGSAASNGTTPSEDTGVTDASARKDAQPDEPGQTTSGSSDARFVASAPRRLGLLVGVGANYAHQVEVYGSDMASSFEHKGKVVVLFGDTYGKVDAGCDTQLGTNDDMVGTLPVEFSGEMPKLDVLTDATAPERFRRVQLLNHGNSIVLDSFKIPVAGFSDGSAAYAMFQPQIPVTCNADAAPQDQGCPAQNGVKCVQNLSFCQPAGVSVPATCEPQSPTCLLGGCTKRAFCIDTHSSQYDGSPRGDSASVMSEVYIGKAHGDDLTNYDVVGTWRTNVFAHPSTRTVAHFSGKTRGSDYGHGFGDVLFWGRPAMQGEQGRQARLYFATVPLPLPESADTFSPRYYAGSDETTGEPRWSDDQAAAVALSMDGTINGDPDDKQAIVTYTTISWLGEPMRRWVMMYGGDLPPELLSDPNGTRAAPNNGSIVMRFAPHPWGPWSPAVVQLPAGSPRVVGDAYGPGGIMYHPDCVDQSPALCARPDAYSLDIIGQCVMRPPPDLGRLYAPAIIDAYTHKNSAGGLDIVWALSTWAPYGAVLMQTSLNPSPQATPHN